MPYDIHSSPKHCKLRILTPCPYHFATLKVALNRLRKKTSSTATLEVVREVSSFAYELEIPARSPIPAVFLINKAILLKFQVLNRQVCNEEKKL